VTVTVTITGRGHVTVLGKVRRFVAETVAVASVTVTVTVTVTVYLF
jgi:hypothetical protein